MTWTGTKINEEEMGSVELSYVRNELSRYLWSELPERTDRIPLVRYILSDHRLRGIRGFLPEGTSYWRNEAHLFRYAGVALEDVERELHGRK